MDSIPPINNQEYVVLDSKFNVVQFSPNIQPYVDQDIIVGKDIRTSLPEIVGLESVCQEILSGQQQQFILESITRVEKKGELKYFDLRIQLIEQHLTILIDDVTELTTLKQISMQRLNEIEITLNKLQVFEYCTNKIIASMQDILFIATPDGKIERVNKSAIKMIGRKRSELINQQIDLLIQDQNFNHQQTHKLLLAAPNSVIKVEVAFETNTKQIVQIEFSCFIAPTEVKNFFNCVYIGRDITARKNAEAEIQKSLAREKELRKLKSGFISMASHEFRNPLSSILLCTQNLQENSDLQPAQKKFFLKSIKDAALNMNSLLEDILILSKAESGKRELKLEAIDLKEFCLQVIQELVGIYAGREINFIYLPNETNFNLDRINLRHILSNLLSNALKYSPTTEVVSIEISSPDNLNEVIINICDRGIGIPVESQQHLFESFYRAGNVNNAPGTGLGLSIVKKAVDLHQGLICIDSEENQGTNIMVRIPIS